MLDTSIKTLPNNQVKISRRLYLFQSARLCSS